MVTLLSAALCMLKTTVNPSRIGGKNEHKGRYCGRETIGRRRTSQKTARREPGCQNSSTAERISVASRITDRDANDLCQSSAGRPIPRVRILIFREMAQLGGGAVVLM